MVKGKAAAADVRVPQNREEAAGMIAEFGAAQREAELIETAMKEKLAGIKAEAEKDAAVHVEKAKQLLAGLLVYATANRQALLGDSGIKTADLGTGTIAWRWKPSRVTLSGEHQDIIDRIQAKVKDADQRHDIAAAKSFLAFLRVTTEIDKEGMLKNADLARTIDGVRIGRAGEVFEVTPFAPKLSEAAE